MRERKRVNTAALAGVAALVAGCSLGTGPGPDGYLEVADHLSVQHDGGLLFLARDHEPGTHMDALFRGRIVTDGAGCLRFQDDLEDPGYAVTPVWPVGYRLRVNGDGAATILDGDGRLVGEVGGAFELGGGEVPAEILEDLGFTAADRELAEARCPGRYWIVSPPAS